MISTTQQEVPNKTGQTVRGFDIMKLRNAYSVYLQMNLACTFLSLWKGLPFPVKKSQTRLLILHNVYRNIYKCLTTILINILYL